MADLGVRRTKGFGLLDLLLALIVASLLAALAVPVYGEYAGRARVTRAIGDIGSISVRIETFRRENDDRIPDSLDELNGTVPLDPWGNTYRYLNIGSGKGSFRKDGNLNPLNTDFDLYSMGEDEDSKGPLSAKASRDDIMRANNGVFIGLGEDY